MDELVGTVSIYSSGVLNSICFVDTARAAASSAQAKGTQRRRRSDRASSSARLESKGKKRRKTVVGLSMAMSALCSVASVVRIVPRSSVETSSSTGDSAVATSISRSISVKLPPLLAQQQQQQQLVSAAGKCMAASSSVEMTIADPSLQYANLMWFRGSYNAQVFVGEDEPADSVVRRFRKAVMMAGVIPECRRRRFFETPQDIVKRKQQNARRRKPR